MYFILIKVKGLCANTVGIIVKLMIFLCCRNEEDYNRECPLLHPPDILPIFQFKTKSYS